VLLPWRRQATPPQELGPVGFFGVVVASLGGPLALAALYVPGLLSGVTGSAWLITVLGPVLFVAPLLIWVRFSRQVASSGGLYAYVREATGQPLALTQAALWIFSYVLYLVYTTAAIVYDTLPTVLGGVRPYQAALEIAIPVLLAAIMLAGRGVAVAVIAALAAGQLVLVVVLAALALQHGGSFHPLRLPASASAAGSASGQVALLYVCGSLPLFLGGEVRRPTRTVPRGVLAAYLLVAASVVAVVVPLAARPGFTRAPIPGMALAQAYAGHPLAVTVGLGVAASTAALILVEYVALSRLLSALTTRSIRTTVRVLAIVLVLSAPLTLVNPHRIYNDLLRPSLVALWLSQIIVFAAYPRFATRRGARLPSALALSVAASLLGGYGLYISLHTAAT
jgi:amino acid transporter